MEKILIAVFTTTVWALLVGGLAFAFKKDISALLGRVKKVGPAELEAAGQQALVTVTPPQVPVAAPVISAPAGSLPAKVEEFAVSSAKNFSEGERANFFKAQLVAAAVGLTYEQANYVIFGSQLQLLLELNGATTVIFRASEIYRRVAELEPAFYSTYPFELWIGWLERNSLVSNVDGNLSITYDGREFLKYLIHRGYPMVRQH